MKVWVCILFLILMAPPIGAQDANNTGQQALERLTERQVEQQEKWLRFADVINKSFYRVFHDELKPANEFFSRHSDINPQIILLWNTIPDSVAKENAYAELKYPERHKPEIAQKVARLSDAEKAEIRSKSTLYRDVVIVDPSQKPVADPRYRSGHKPPKIGPGVRSQSVAMALDEIQALFDDTWIETLKKLEEELEPYQKKYPDAKEAIKSLRTGRKSIEKWSDAFRDFAKTFDSP